MGEEIETAMRLPEILRRVRVWPQCLTDQVLMDIAHGRTEIFVYNVKLGNGKSLWWQVPKSRDIVVAVAIDDNNVVHFVEQWRPAWEKSLWVLPGGGVEKKNAKEKDIEDTLRRELQQEIGCNCNELEKLVTILCSARIKSKQHIYLATELSPLERTGNFVKLERYEKQLQAQPRELPFVEAYRKFVVEKEETTSYTVLGLLFAKEKLGFCG